MNPTIIFLVLAACGDTVGPVTLPAPQVVRAVDGAGLFAWSAEDPVLSSARQRGDPVRLEWRVDADTWSYVEGVAGQDMAADTRYWIPTASLLGTVGAPELRLVAGQDASDTVQPVILTATADLVAPDAPLIADDTLQIDLALQSDTLPPASGAVDLSLSRTGAQGVQTDPVDPDCLDGSQLDECLLAELLQAPVDDITAPLSLPAWHPVHADPATLQFTARIWLDAVGLTGSPVRGLVAQATTAELASMGRTLYWGDLHGHTNLSYDGCELPDQQCDHRGDYAAQDFFDNARAVGLDFVAITDHAEWERYYPDGLSGSSVDIWTEEQRITAANDGNGLVALVGYEWTNRRDSPAESEADKYYKGTYEGGHKTVVFSDLDVPVDYRIGAPLSVETTTKNGLSAYTVGGNPKTDDPQEFYALLDDAAAANGSIPVLSFFHHSAIEKPQGVDYGDPNNAPDSRYERLIEVYSEHGSSECLDPKTTDCDWHVNDANYRYLPRGSVQYALSMGYRLGFVGGTDSHDGRPGSIDDGPSSTGNPGGSALSEPIVQFDAGGLTGAWVAGPLDRVSLFDSLYQRATLATSGPRPDVRVLALADDGRVWLPGQVIPLDAGSIRILARISDDTLAVQHIALIGDDGTVQATVDGELLDQDVDLVAGSAWYLRVVLGDEKDPQRVWISPFFTESAG